MKTTIRKSLKTRVTLLTLLVFLTGTWLLVIYASWIQREELKHLHLLRPLMISVAARAKHDKAVLSPLQKTKTHPVPARSILR